MGYTHYFKQKKVPTQDQWAAITNGFQRLQIVALLTKAFPIQREANLQSPPEITDEHIVFNGIGDDAHETMELLREYAAYHFCKTAHKPYDRAVIALLILVHRCAPGCWNIHSDGDPNDWQPTLDWMNTTGMGKFKMPPGVLT